MLETITSVNGVVNGIVWGPVGLALLFGTGFVMSVRTGFFQFGHFLNNTALPQAGQQKPQWGFC